MTRDVRDLGDFEVAQRVVVRMMHDPVFRAAVFAEPERVLAGEGVAGELARSIAGHDIRAFGVDEFRGHRVVRSMLEEVPVTVLALAHAGVAVQSHMTFMQSPWFHRAVMERGLLIEAFVGYVGERVDARRREVETRRGREMVATAAAMLALEWAFARVRRRRDVAACRCQAVAAVGAGREVVACGAGALVGAGCVVGVTVPGGTTAAWETGRRGLGGEPVEALLRGKLPTLGVVGGEDEAVLVELDAAGEPVASFSGAALVALVGRVERGPVERGALVAMAMAEGADEAEADEIIGELLADGVLVHVGP